MRKNSYDPWEEKSVRIDSNQQIFYHCEIQTQCFVHHMYMCECGYVCIYIYIDMYITHIPLTEPQNNI